MAALAARRTQVSLHEGLAGCEKSGYTGTRSARFPRRRPIRHRGQPVARVGNTDEQVVYVELIADDEDVKGREAVCGMAIARHRRSR